MNINQFIRPDLQNIVPYSSARDEFKGEASIFLDANENNLYTKFNRYPDPLQKQLKSVISKKKNIPTENLFIGNGSDEVLDLVYRLTLRPGKDAVATLNPSYGMYSVLSTLNGVSCHKINLDEDFDIEIDELVLQSKHTKLLIICNPNNPTGKLWKKSKLIEIVQKTSCLVVVDEAYIDFCPEESMTSEVVNFPNLIVVQTLSKAYGMAGLRVGMAIASPEWISALNSIKPPYNLSSLVQEKAIEELESSDFEASTALINSERLNLEGGLSSINQISRVFESSANFILLRTENALELYDYLASKGVVVRDRGTQYNCEGCLRISIGTPEENKKVITDIKSFYTN